MKNLTRIYILALLLIGSFIVASHFIILHVVQEKSGDARVINLSGRQRMLSQFITKHTLLLNDSMLLKHTDEHTERYLQAIYLFEKSHKALQFGDDSLLIPKQVLSNEINSLFQLINPHFESITKAALSSLETKEAAKQEILLTLLASEKEFLPLMDKITFQFEKEANARLSRLQLLETVIQVSAIIILLLIAFFVFRPVVLKNKYYLNELEISNNSLKSSNKELKSSKKALKKLTDDLLDSQEEFKRIAEELQFTNKTLSESQQQLERLSLVAQKTTNGIIISDAKGNIEWTNKGFSDITGYTASEMQGKKPGEFLQGEETDKNTVEYISKKLEQKETVEADIVNYTKAGELYWVHLLITPIFDSEGKHDGFIAIEHDITERKQTELQLKENNKFLEEINSLKLNLIKERDINKGLPETLRILKTLANVKLVSIFKNISTEEKVKINLLCTYSAENKSGVGTDFVWELHENERSDSSWYAKLQKGENVVLSVADFPKEIKDRLVAKKIISVLLMPIFADNTFFGFISFESIDRVIKWNNLQEFSFQSVVNSIGSIIRRNDILKELEGSQEKLQQLNEKVNFELDSFFYSASHDLRRPVTTALGLIQLANQSADIDDKSRYLTFLQDTIVKLDQLILDIIQISKNKTLEVNKTDDIQFESFFQGIFDELKYYEAADKITLILDVLQDCAFSSDSKRLKSVFSNIVSNAIKYHNLYQESPKVEITVRADQKEAMIIIKDNGTGIPSEHLSKLFDVFYRANESKSGSGLGLYIAKETVTKIGGEIKVDSKVGEGTTFYINIPNYSTVLQAKKIS